MPDGTVRGTFSLSAQPAISQLRAIRDVGGEADASLERLGGRMDTLAHKSRETATNVKRSWGSVRDTFVGKTESMGVALEKLDDKITRFGRKRASATVELTGFDRVNAQLTEIEMRLDSIDRKRASARVAIGGGFSNVAGGGGGGGGGGGMFSSLGGIPGRLPWWAAAAPIAPGLLGGATSLAGSATSAALGAGTVGLGGAAALGVGGLGTFAGAKGAITDLQNLTKAQTAYNTAVQTYGRNSSQAATAGARFNQVLRQNPGAAPAARSLATFRRQATTALAPARGQFYRGMTGVLNNATRALPALGQDARISTSATASAAVSYSHFLTDPTMLSVAGDLTRSFAQNLPIAERSLQNMTVTFGHLAVDAQPFFREANLWVEHWTGGLAHASSNTERVQSRMQGYVNSAKDWGRLLGAAYHLVRDIFSAGTPQGDSMVVRLTDSLGRWDQWVNRNPGRVTQFFNQAETTTTRVATVVGNLVHDIAQIFNYLQPILSRATQFLQFASGLGPGGLSLLGGGLYGAYEGARGALGGRGPSAGTLARSYVMGAPSFSRGGRGMGGATVPETAPVVAGSLRSRVGGVATGLAMGAMRTVAPLLLINAGLQALGAHGGVQAHIGAGLSGLTGGIVSPHMAPGVEGALGGVALASLASRVLPSLAVRSAFSGAPNALVGGLTRLLPRAGSAPGLLGSLGIRTGGGALDTLGSVGTAAAMRFALPVIGAYAGLMMNPDSTGISLGSPRMRGLLHGVGTQAAGVRTPGQMHAVDATVTRLRMSGFEMSPADRTRLNQYLTRVSDAAAQNAGASASNAWQTAFTTALDRGMSPKKAVATLLNGIQPQMEQLGPRGRTALLRSTAQWISTLEQQNPRLRRPLERALNQITDDANKMNRTTGQSFSDLQNKLFTINGQTYKGTSATWGAIRDDLINKAQTAQERLLGIFGTIQTEAVNALVQMGFTRGQARSEVTALTSGNARRVSVAKAQVGFVAGGNPLSAASPGHRRARGGVIGGTGLLDTVPVPGGMAAPGEAYIANRHTMADISLATLQRYGKTAWQMIQEETRQHSDPVGSAPPGARPQPKSGIMPGFTTGGAAGFPASGRAIGPVGSLPRMVAEANAITSHHYPYLWGGGHNSNFSGPYDCSGSVSAVLHAGGVLNSPEVAQQFMSFGQPGPGPVTLYASPGHVYMSMNGRFFGTSSSNPGGGAAWFNGAPRPGFVQRHVPVTGGMGRGALGAGASAAGGLGGVTLAAPGSGMFGIPGAMVGRGSQMYAAGLQQRLNGMLGGLGGISGAGWSGGGSSGANQALGRRMMLSAGWGPGQWPSLQALWTQESGWNANAVNPSSGAYGIPQALGHGHPYNLGDAPAQIAWGLNYIRGRYGSPAAAEAHERSNNWYSRGGRAGFSGWHARGGSWVTNGPTVFGAGETPGRRERVTITPATAPRSQTTGGHSIAVHFHGPVHIRSDKDVEEIGRHVAAKIIDALDAAQAGVSDLELAQMGGGA